MTNLFGFGILEEITTATANFFSWLIEHKKEYFSDFLPISLTVGPCLEFEVWISRNDILSRIDFITDSLRANLPAKCS